MRILAVDTSTQAGSLAVLDDERVRGVVSTWVEEPYSSRLFRHLEFLLRELNMEMAAVELYAVAAGPGSFTGLRVGLTAVKGWAEVYGKPIAAVSGLEAVAAQARAAEASGGPLLVPVVDARRGQVFAGTYRREGERLARSGDDVVMTLDEFLAELKTRAGGDTVAFVTPTPELLAGRIADSPFRGCRIEAVSTVLAPVVGRLGLERARRGELVDALTLDAHYVRRSDAELLWRG